MPVRSGAKWGMQTVGVCRQLACLQVEFLDEGAAAIGHAQRHL